MSYNSERPSGDCSLKFVDSNTVEYMETVESLGVPTIYRHEDATLESLRSLKPLMLSKWMNALDDWATVEGLPMNPFEQQHLRKIIANVFIFLESNGECDGAGKLCSSGVHLPEVINCNNHESVCVGLFKTGMEVIHSSVNSFNNLNIIDHVLGHDEQNKLIENALRMAVHLEIGGCERQCVGRNCPMANANLLGE